MMFRLVILASSAFVLLGASLPLFAQDDPAPPRPGARRAGGRGAQGTRDFLGMGPAPDEAAAKKGDPTYKQYCGGCHGQTGRGAQGPNLLRAVSVLHDEKGEEIGPIILKGRTGMPAFPNLSKDEIYNISQYLKLQVELTTNRGTYNSQYAELRNKTSGDPKKGAEFFASEGGCTQCHSVTGDLAKIGTKFQQPALMQARFLWPAPQGPPKVKVTIKSGEAVEGTLRTLSDFELSMTDISGEYRYFKLSEVKVEKEDKLAGHRALLPKYTDANIHDLAAYLVTVK